MQTSSLAFFTWREAGKILFGLALQDAAAAEAAAAEAGGEGGKASADDTQLESLWTGVVESLLQSSHERKALAFQLFTILLPNLRYVAGHRLSTLTPC